MCDTRASCNADSVTLTLASLMSTSLKLDADDPWLLLCVVAIARSSAGYLVVGLRKWREDGLGLCGLDLTRLELCDADGGEGMVPIEPCADPRTEEDVLPLAFSFLRVGLTACDAEP